MTDEDAKEIAAVFANVELIDDSGEPNTLSLNEIQKLGSALLGWFEGDEAA